MNPYELPLALLSSFLALVAVMALVVVYVIRRQFSDKRWLGWAGLAVWLAVPAVLAYQGLLADMTSVPPPAMLVIFPMMVVVIALALSPIGKKVASMPVVFLVGVQMFRIPLEIMLHQLHLEGHLPAEMTYTGWNFDILTGLGALGIVLWSRRGEVPRWVIAVWNAVGSVLLVIIVSMAAASTPAPFGLFEIKNTIATSFPVIWLPTFLVQLALFGHIVILRNLLAHKAKPSMTTAAPAEVS